MPDTAAQTENVPAMKLLLVGCGKMGGAMLRGWLDGGMVDACRVVDISDATLPDDDRVVFAENAGTVPDDFTPDVVIFAVKPQIMDDVAPLYRRYADGETLFLSIAAGKPVAFFEDALGADARIVRAMPNTPAAIGRGVTVAYGNAGVTESDRGKVAMLLSAVSHVFWVEDEMLMDPVTAVSGSGPAYVFLLVEAMANAGEKAGLPRELAEDLARDTVTGSAALIEASPDVEPAQLRENVTSPKGTTWAALQVLMDAQDGVQPLFDKAIQAATDRSKELSG